MLHIAILVVIVIVLLVGALLVVVATRPSQFRYVRSAVIKAPAETIFGLIGDFRRWALWSPYEKRDPAMTKTYGATTSGQGAIYEWAGDNKSVGAGRMEILQSATPSKLLIKLDFVRPFEGHNMAEFTLTPQGDAVLVVWAMSGPSPLMARLMGLVINFDKMIGKDFETGLADLKTVAETSAIA